jgi:serine protease AprX
LPSFYCNFFHMSHTRQFIVFLVFYLFSGTLFAQAVVYKKYFVTFRDKLGSNYSVMQPQYYLTKASLDRRAQARIVIDSTDLPVSKVYLEAVRAVSHRELVRTRWLNGVAVLADSLQLLSLKKLPFVKSIEYVGPFYGFRFPDNQAPKPRVVRDTMPIAEGDFAQFVDGYAFMQNRLMSSSGLTDLLGSRGKGIDIAVMDGGFTNVDASPFFRDLADRGGILSTHDFVAGDAGVYEASGHGAGVFSVMAASSPYFFTASATDANYHLLITEDTGGEFPIEELNWIAGAEYADSVGVHIINASLGYTTFNDTTLGHRYYELDGKTALGSRGAAIAVQKGMIICNSAGNSGDEAWKYVGVPADTRGIVSVGAVDMEGTRSSFSSQGPTPDGRIKPDLMSPGENVAAMSPDGLDVQAGSGTSYASPILAAGFAALWSCFPEKTGQEITDLVYRSTMLTTAPNTMTGYGIPDFLLAYLLGVGVTHPTHRSLLHMEHWNKRTQGLEFIFSYPMTEAEEEDPRKVRIPLSIRLNDASGRVNDIALNHQSTAMYRKAGVLHSISIAELQCASGWVKYTLIFAEGDPINGQIWINEH